MASETQRWESWGQAKAIGSSSISTNDKEVPLVPRFNFRSAGDTDKSEMDGSEAEAISWTYSNTRDCRFSNEESWVRLYGVITSTESIKVQSFRE